MLLSLFKSIKIIFLLWSCQNFVCVCIYINGNLVSCILRECKKYARKHILKHSKIVVPLHALNSLSYHYLMIHFYFITMSYIWFVKKFFENFIVYDIRSYTWELNSFAIYVYYESCYLCYCFINFPPCKISGCVSVNNERATLILLSSPEGFYYLFVCLFVVK